MYRFSDCLPFLTIQSVSLAKRCVVLSLCTVHFLYLAPPVFAQIAHPYGNTQYELNFKKLQKKFGQLLSGVTLRTGLARISEGADVPIWLDRNIDGEQTIQVQFDQSTFQQAIDEIIAPKELAIAWVGGTIYICSKNKSQSIEKAYWNTSLANNSKLGAIECPSLQWSEPVEPRMLFAILASENRVALSGIERCEHDLWAPQNLPPMSLAARMTILLAGFNSTLAFNSDDSGEIVDWPTEPANNVDYAYKLSMLRQIPKDKKLQWQQTWNAKVTWKNGADASILSGPVEAHRELITATFVPAKSDSIGDRDERMANVNERAILKGLERQRFTLRLQGRLIDVLPPLAKQLNLKLETVTWSSGLRGAPIDVDVRTVTLDELLEVIAKNGDVQISRIGLKIEVTAAPK